MPRTERVGTVDRRARLEHWRIGIGLLALLGVAACGGGLGKNGTGASCNPTFDGAGFLTKSGTAGGTDDRGAGVAIDSHSRIVVAGRSDDGKGQSNLAVWRWTSDGCADTTFANNGSATRVGTAGGTSDQGTAVAIDLQDRVVVAGFSKDGNGNENLAVWRYTATGSLDMTFANNGIATKLGTAGGTFDEGDAVAIDAQGRIVVAGVSNDINGNENLAVWRYTSNGTLDPTFNQTGYVTLSKTGGGTHGDFGDAVAVDKAGRIVVAGFSSDVANNAILAVWRFNDDGSSDLSFHGGSVVQANTAGGNHDIARGVAIDSQGRIVVAGFSSFDAHSDGMAVWCYTSDGSLDTTFHSTGYFTKRGTAGGNDDAGLAVVVDSQDRIVVSGVSSAPASQSPLAIWRLTHSGELDTTFNGGGFVLGSSSGQSNAGEGIALDGLGRLVVTGDSFDTTSKIDSVAVWRYTSDGH